jgi:hypothetical protein
LLRIVEVVPARHRWRKNLETVHGHILKGAYLKVVSSASLDPIHDPDELSELGDILDLDPGKESGDGLSSKVTSGGRQAEGRGYE